MKKKIALLGALGVAGGLLYALESRHRRNKNANEPHDTHNQSDAVGNGQSISDAKVNERAHPQPAASMARIEEGTPVISEEHEHLIDDQGTDQAAASEILKHIRDNAFESSDEKLALALGRPTDEIEEWTSGNGLIDGDVILKARALAMQRGFQI
jgi:hypothetical protein